MPDKKTCYIIGEIGDPDSDKRNWADFIRDNVVEPAVTECGYKKPVRADDPDINLIMQDIIKQMFEADLVIADLTNHNPNVFYELGIRNCAQKPAIHLIQTEQEPPFDLGGNKAISVDDKHKTVIKAVSDIKSRIQAITSNPDQFHSQVQQHIQFNQLELFRKSQTDKNELLIDILKTLMQSANIQSRLISDLHKELIEKPKIKYPTHLGTFKDALSEVLKQHKLSAEKD